VSVGTTGIEREIRKLCKADDYRSAAEMAIEHYGAEVYGFLVATLRDAEEAAEAFAQAGADLCAGLCRFEWRCPIRAWLYVLARNAASRGRRSAARRNRRQVPISQISEIAARERTRTATWRRTESRDAIERIRESLDADDRCLLVLRVDRELGWLQIAQIMSGGELREAQLPREAARLRKRFQLVKEKLRAGAKQAGLIRREGE
jgi:RNA polymerase sigma-70 factor, ECF subfamily